MIDPTLQKKEIEPILRYGNIQKYHCSICGNEEYLQKQGEDYRILYIDKEINTMLIYKVCRRCAYWINLIHNPPEDLEIINKGAWIIKPMIESGPLKFINKSNEEFVNIQRKNLTYTRTNRSYFIGYVPLIFIDKFPNTAKFISKAVYKKICRGRLCKRIGCWDRYNCMRYNISIEKLSGPYNVIPKYHVIGDENCPSFINSNI